MRIVPVPELQEGDRLCQNVFTTDGRLVLAKGMVLTAALIKGLLKMRIDQVYIDNSRDHNAELIDAGGKMLRHHALQVIRSVFRDVAGNGTVPSKPVLEMTNELSRRLSAADESIIQIKENRSNANYLLAHSVNVCMLAVMTAKALGYNEQHIRTVAIGSLLHDIGYVVPNITSPSSEHPIAGFEIIRKHADLPLLAAHIVLQHHEQVNGAGFPHGVSGDALRQSAQICSIANDFDHFVNEIGTNRLPHEGIEYVMSKVDSSYDYSIVRAFVQVVMPYPVGTIVSLSDSRIGRVIQVHKGSPSRPVLEIIGGGEHVDLLKHTTIVIRSVVLENQQSG